MPVFPSEIVADILSRLPVKSLLRFRCVSKPWCGLIDSHHFKKLHLNQSIKTNSNLNLILGYNGKTDPNLNLILRYNETHSVSIDSLDSAKPLNPPFSESSFCNSCNGLILAFAKTPYVWNPFTRKYKEIPHSPVEYPAECNLEYYVETHALAYISETDDYKVLRVVEFRDSDGVWMGSETKVFSLRSNAWKRIEDFSYGHIYKRVFGAHVNGNLHKVFKTDFFARDWSILAFDARNESHYFIPKPDIDREERRVTVEVFGGCLCLLDRLANYGVDVWVMKEYGVKDSWCKLLSVAPPVVTHFVWLYPLVFSQDGAEVLLNCKNEQLLWYNLKSKTMRKVTIRGLPSVVWAKLCVESLVSFDDFISVDDGKERSQADVEKQSQEKRRKAKRDTFLSQGFKLVL